MEKFGRQARLAVIWLMPNFRMADQNEAADAADATAIADEESGGRFGR